MTRAWVSPQFMGAGTVGVGFVCDGNTGSIFPDSDKVDEVAAYLESHTDPITGAVVGRPVTAELYVFAPSASPLDFTIQVSPNTTAVREAVTASLEDLLEREAEPGGELLLSHIREAISLSIGETDHTLVSPASDLTAGAGELFVLGTITWA